MRRIRMLSVLMSQLFSMAVFAQGNWDGSSISTTTITGKVGIGTASPGASLQINTLAPNTSMLRFYYNDGNTYPRLYLESSTTAYTFTTHYATSPIDLKFGTPYTTEALVIKPTGNIGIGTSQPGSFKLAVEGKLGAREIEVTDVPTWPDYVFDKEYELMDLREVENFILANKHLPGVPTDKEVHENGLNLAKTDAILLEKIEEIMLYLIELKKENEQLREMITRENVQK